MNNIQIIVETFKASLENVSMNPNHPVIKFGDSVFVESVEYKHWIDEASGLPVGQVEIELRPGGNNIFVKSPVLFAEGLQTWFNNILEIACAYGREVHILTEECLMKSLAIEGVAMEDLKSRYEPVVNAIHDEMKRGV